MVEVLNNQYVQCEYFLINVHENNCIERQQTKDGSEFDRKMGKYSDEESDQRKSLFRMNKSINHFQLFLLFTNRTCVLIPWY